MGDVFQRDKELVEEVYRTNKNYYVWDIDENNKKCLILFSSNGLYAPNTREAFEEKIIKKDRYEFKNVTNCRRVKKQFGRIIYVRDLWRAWYVKGINETEDMIDKVIVRLRELTDGYQIVTAGISSGGYMAVIVGIKLHAEKVLSFSGQFCIDENRRRGIIKQYEKDEVRNKYFDITDMISYADVPIIYFYPNKSEWDIEQAERVREYKNVIMIAFDYAEHAQTVIFYNLKYLFDMSVKRYKKWDNKTTKRVFTAPEFLVISGGVQGILDCFRGLLYIIKKNVLNFR